MADWNNNAKTVLEARYLKRNSKGDLLETYDGMLHRVAEAVVKAEKEADRQKYTEKFAKLLDSLVFLPNSPTLMNAGRDLGQLSSCITGDSVVRCCRGDTTIKELANEYKDRLSERFEVFSVNSFGSLAVGKAFNPRLTRNNAPVFRVTFDDGSYLKATEEHLLMHRNGKYSEIQRLNVGQSVMPFNYADNHGYRIVFARIDKIPIGASRFIYETVAKDKLKKNEVIHHIDFNKANDQSSNLQKRDKLEHFLWHSQNSSGDNNPMRRFPHLCLAQSERMKGEGNPLRKFPHLREEQGKRASKYLIGNHNAKTVGGETRTCLDCGIAFEVKLNSLKQRCKPCAVRENSGFRKGTCAGENNPNYGSGRFAGTPWWAKDNPIHPKTKLPIKNHKIVSVEFEGFEDVYDLSVEEHHNFAVNNVFVHNCFVLPIEDDISAIFEAVKQSAIIHKSGGGTGFSFSKIRPAGTMVKSTNGVASGPVSFMKVFNASTEVVKQGGKRRGANLGTLICTHPDIEAWIDCKLSLEAFQNFNISVSITDEFLMAVEKDLEFLLLDPSRKSNGKTIKAKQLFDTLCHNAWFSGEPGVIFIDSINQKNPTPWLGQFESTNPCVTGDTMIAVADGRNAVPMRQLVNEGKDVPVYCVDKEGKVEIRYGRNPRLTKSNVKVYKVNFDDGGFIRATENHEFVLKDGSRKKLSEFTIGDSLLRFNKFQYLNKGKNYWAIKNSTCGQYAEHRIMAKFFGGDEFSEEKVVHHNDFDGLNNAWINLRICTSKEHGDIHDIRGGKNPMNRFPEKNWMNDPQKQAEMRSKYHVGKKRSKKVRRNISRALTRAYLDPQVHVRVSEGTRIGMQKNWAHFEESLHKRAEKRLRDCQEKTDLKCFLESNKVMVRKVCEGCGNTFDIGWSYREISFHSHECYLKYQGDPRFGYQQKRTLGINVTNEWKTKQKNQAQVACFNSLKNQLGRVPLQKEWKECCKEHEVSSRLGTKYGYFGYRSLKEAAETTCNHKVVSVEFDGYEDVYNMTVDEFHNYVVLTSITEDRLSGVYSLNCGEQPLLPYEACNLGSIDLSKFVKKDDFQWTKLERTIRLCVRFLDNVIDVNKFPKARIDAKTKLTRKIGLGVMGWADALIEMNIKYGSSESYEFAEKMMKFINEISHNESHRLGLERGPYSAIRKGSKIMRNATLTTIAPTGTLSIIGGCSSSIEPLYDRKYSKSIFDGVKLDLGKDYSHPKAIVTAHELTPLQHVKMQAVFQKYTDNAVSKTINLDSEATEEEVKSAFLEGFMLKCKGLTVYRDGSRVAPLQSIEELSECENGKCSI